MATPPTLSAPTGAVSKKRQRPPTPSELVGIYESQGLDHHDASLKAIADLQTVLHRTIATSRAANKDRSAPDTSRKLDNLNTRLAILELKLDSKPGFPHSLAIGVASGAALHGIAAALGALANIWNTVNRPTS